MPDRLLNEFQSRRVSWLIQACKDVQYDVNDPLIGQVVVMTATIPCLFQFAGDPKVSEKAQDDLAKCKKLLESHFKTVATYLSKDKWLKLFKHNPPLLLKSAVVNTDQEDTANIST